MSAAYQVHIVFLQESGNDIGSKGKRDSTVVFAPAGDVLVRVGPEKIAKEAAVRNLSPSEVNC